MICCLDLAIVLGNAKGMTLTLITTANVFFCPLRVMSGRDSLVSIKLFPLIFEKSEDKIYKLLREQGVLIVG